MTCFIHTADWQLGKPFSRVADPDRQANLRRQRLESLDRIGDVARQQQASFVVVAGDVFDSHRPPDRLVSLALERIGRLGLPVYIIPGNHDYGGPGSLWESEHFQRENRELAPNLTVLLAAEPVDRDDAILLPCPLLRR
ncbi:MAG: DNA repair exonuclease, partial [Planctomycetia bacterium]|nr:DNA repair exonuclease [Planctomycetia bacterium]